MFTKRDITIINTLSKNTGLSTMTIRLFLKGLYDIIKADLLQKHRARLPLLGYLKPATKAKVSYTALKNNCKDIDSPSTSLIFKCDSNIRQLVNELNNINYTDEDEEEIYYTNTMENIKDDLYRHVND